MTWHLAGNQDSDSFVGINSIPVTLGIVAMGDVTTISQNKRWDKEPCHQDEWPLVQLGDMPWGILSTHWGNLKGMKFLQGQSRKT